MDPEDDDPMWTLIAPDIFQGRLVVGNLATALDDHWLLENEVRLRERRQNTLGVARIGEPRRPLKDSTLVCFFPGAVVFWKLRGFLPTSSTVLVGFDGTEFQLKVSREHSHESQKTTSKQLVV